MERLAGEASVYFEVGGKNGSGVLIEGGYVMTAAHVASVEVMRVQTKDGRWYNACADSNLSPNLSIKYERGLRRASFVNYILLAGNTLLQYLSLSQQKLKSI